MNKSILMIAVLFFGTINLAQAQGNYILIINGDSVRIDLDNDIDYQTVSGEKLVIRVAQPEILTYRDDMISFDHHKSLTVSNSKIDAGIEQCILATSTGTSVMVQKHKMLDPSGLTRLMMNEITKESISFGYSKSEKKFRKKIKSGQKIEGIQAKLTYQGDTEIYTVATYGAENEGIIVVTMLLNDDFKGDQEIIELFLETLSINE